jgi:hypothetical protein
MSSSVSRILIAMLALLSATSCQTVFAPKLKCKSPLAPAHMTTDSCVLDVYFINVPLGDVRANDELWKEIDEQRFAPDLRQRLGGNGFRVGLVGSQIPIALSQLMELKNKPAPTEDTEVMKLNESADGAHVMLRHIQTPPGQPNPIIASGIYEQLTVLLWNESGRVGGETYEQAQGVFVVKPYPQPDGQVRLEITPELQYGQPKQNFALDPANGVTRMDFGKRKRSFNELAINATLAPGSMLVMCGLPNRPGSLGYNFFTQKEGKPIQKLLIIRLSQTQHDDLFDPGETLKLPEK